MSSSFTVRAERKGKRVIGVWIVTRELWGKGVVDDRGRRIVSLVMILQTRLGEYYVEARW
jgi:hypothetical protein